MQETSDNKLEELKNAFLSSQKILILISKNPSFDGLAAGLALYLAIKKLKKDVDIYCETPAIVENANLIGIDKIKNSVGNKNLVISFDYIDGSIERVSYNIEGDKFKLTIQPKEGKAVISPEKVSFSYSGLSADLIFTIECQKLSDLGKIIEKESDFFEKTKMVNIDHRKGNSFAQFNVNTPGVLSCSELVLSLFQSFGLLTDADISTNILMGIEYASVSFSDPRLDATTFETVAYLLKQGAKRKKVPALKTEIKEEKKEPTITQEKRGVPKTEAPADWLQPKIYKGGQLL